MEDFTLIAIGDILILYAHDLFIRKKPAIFLRKKSAWSASARGGNHILVPKLFTCYALYRKNIEDEIRVAKRT